MITLIGRAKKGLANTSSDVLLSTENNGGELRKNKVFTSLDVLQKNKRVVCCSCLVLMVDFQKKGVFVVLDKTPHFLQGPRLQPA